MSAQSLWATLCASNMLWFTRYVASCSLSDLSELSKTEYIIQGVLFEEQDEWRTGKLCRTNQRSRRHHLFLHQRSQKEKWRCHKEELVTLGRTRYHKSKCVHPLDLFPFMRWTVFVLSALCRNNVCFTNRVHRVSHKSSLPPREALQYIYDFDHKCPLQALWDVF